MQSTEQKMALVLGATGGIGGAVARNLLKRGWHIKALTRDIGKAGKTAGDFEWIAGDALNPGDVSKAAEGVSLIVHAVNPPGYRDWEKLVVPMLDNTIAAAKQVGARVLLPGTVYNFGPDAFPVLGEDSPQHPVTRKGRLRVMMEQRLKDASASGLDVLIVRAGDFFGPKAANNWFSQGLVTPGKPVSLVSNPSRRGIGHQWAFLPDVAETMAQLVDRAETLPRFAVYHMEGFWDADGMQMAAAIRRVVGRPVKVRSFPWWIVPIMAPFNAFMHELKEMRYLWKQPLRMTNTRLVGILGAEPRTPIDEAVRQTLADLGCL
ncbi:NAD(P)H-binding protein [Phyllobacterium calauticae]|jgi:nucleoside-diphosphate-sugar epimerase|uniref:NAD(P)H-binding protein n=1 Tax=Phyllobacterium calauticae TaxID=2817027 RepID=UPI001CBC20F3|nr:NAD(P)H-binding protein [Phyllobacterium calauticae]MBZ3695854.1 NAD(P)H-binding protein [Phyllobacterium calauticae]